MPTFISFAFIGAGGFGKHTVNAMATKEGVSLIVLTRNVGGTEKNFPPNVKIIPVDYSDIEAVAEVLRAHKVEVVISSVHPSGLGNQKLVAEAAKKAEIKLFVPSEYGFPTLGNTEGLFAIKDASANHLKTIGIPYSRFYNGYYMGRLPWVTGLSENGKINYIGSPTALGSTTAEEDVGGFIAHVLTTLPFSQLENRIFRLEGQRFSMQELSELFGTPLEKVEAMPGPKSAILTYFQTKFGAGAGSTGFDVVTQKEMDGESAAGSANHLWPGHKWKTIREVHNL